MKKTEDNILNKQDFFPVREAVRRLGESPYHLKIGYTGLMHYRNLGLIDPPQKIRGYKERFYNITNLFSRIHSIKGISDMFDLNLEEVAAIAKKLPENIFKNMPGYFTMIYSRIMKKSMASREDIKERWGYDILESPLMFNIMRGCFLKAIKNHYIQSKTYLSKIFIWK